MATDTFRPPLGDRRADPNSHSASMFFFGRTIIEDNQLENKHKSVVRKHESKQYLTDFETKFETKYSHHKQNLHFEKTFLQNEERDFRL